MKEDKEIISFATGAMPKYKFIKELGIEWSSAKLVVICPPL
jgi:hypothetical protein